MENQIDTFLTQLMENLNESINNTNNTNNNNNINNNNNTTVNSNPLRYVNRQLDTISNLITLYNYNQIEYQRNIQTMLSLIQLNHQSFRMRLNQQSINTPNPTTYTNRTNHTRANPSRNNPTRTNPTRPNNNSNIRREYYWRSPYSNVETNDNRWNGVQNSNIWNGVQNSNIWENDEWANILNTYLNQVEQERRLTNVEITNATRTFTYNEELSETLNDNRCPISLETFVTGDVLSEIRGCHHVFRRDNLLRWFRRSNCCPICRFNLLTQTPAPTSPIASNTPDASNNTPTDTSNNTIPVDTSNNITTTPTGFTYSFTTSYPSQDSSGNHLNLDLSNDIYNLYNAAMQQFTIPLNDISGTNINNSNNDNVDSDDDIPDNASVD